MDGFGIAKSRSTADVNDRDTVGDTYFLRKSLIAPLWNEKLAVATSDYHAARIEVIFKKFSVASDSAGRFWRGQKSTR